jgi:hypothetical protein
LETHQFVVFSAIRTFVREPAVLKAFISVKFVRNRSAATATIPSNAILAEAISAKTVELAIAVMNAVNINVKNVGRWKIASVVVGHCATTVDRVGASVATRGVNLATIMDFAVYVVSTIVRNVFAFTHVLAAVKEYARDRAAGSMQRVVKHA